MTTYFVLGLIFPENVHVNKRVCGRSIELERIATEFWGQTDDRETPTEISKYCLQVACFMTHISIPKTLFAFFDFF